LFLSGCTDHNRYAGNLNPEKYTALSGKRIFIDPGHGGKGSSDTFRTGPGGINEEKLNLQAALVLTDMLKRAGATVMLSRKADRDVTLEKRCEMAHDFKPQVLISIHHNGSPRRADNINYPSVLIWGTKDVNPAGIDLAGLLLEEFEKAIEIKGCIISDFALFHETGTRILRETRTLCPAVIGEFGFFSDEMHAIRLKDKQYIELEAESYFTAIARYFERGIPDAGILVSSPIEGTSTLRDKNPLIGIRIFSGNEKPGIEENSLHVTIDDIPVTTKRLKDDLYLINYGRELYAGSHLVRFSFRNLRHQSSMIDYAMLHVPVQKGDYEKLVREGRVNIKNAASRRDGMFKLLSAYSMAKTDPGVQQLLADISRGFYNMGLDGTGKYYHDRLKYFYPGHSQQEDREYSYRFPVDFYGKQVYIQGNASLQ